MRKPSDCGRVILLLIPSLFILFPLGIIAFTLDRLSEDIVVDKIRSGDRLSDFYGVSFNEGPTAAILGICVLIDIVSAIAIFGIWELRRIEGTSRHQRVWAWIILISSASMAGASAAVFSYTTSVQSNDARVLENTAAGDLTRETWACKYSDQTWGREACGLARATRYLLIPMAVASALVLVSLYILLCDRGGLRWLFGGKGRSAGLENDRELGHAKPDGPSTQMQHSGVSQPAQNQPQPLYQLPA